jgi:hypothetical protein
VKNEFSPNSYLPVLRWKAAEVVALARLDPGIRGFVFPVMELCPTAFIRQKRMKDEILPIKILSKKVAELKMAIGDQLVGIDLIHIKDGEAVYDCKSIWDEIIAAQETVNLKVVPVTGFHGKGVPYQKLVGSLARDFGNGLCLRLSLEDLDRPSLANDVDRLLSMLGHDTDEIHLVVDLRLVNSSTPKYTNISAKVPRLAHWRSLTLLGGSFPPDLSHLEANNRHEIPRLEWLKWKAEVSEPGDRVIRTASFGDYTIQHPLYREPVRNPRVSASIRYTASDRWVVFRGEWIGSKKGSGSAQYPAWAQLLVARTDLFRGAEFSYGDEYIMRKSKDASKPGRVQDWLTVGINHHITYTVCQIHPELLMVEKKEAVPVARTAKPGVPSIT